MATNENGHHAEFSVEAAKIHHGNETRTAGSVLLAKGSRTESIRFNMHVNSLTVVENLAEMSGPAVLRVQTPNGVHEYQGHGSARVQSNRHPGEVGAHDVIAVRFTRDGGPNFEFAGRVTRGDITVGKSVDY